MFFQLTHLLQRDYHDLSVITYEKFHFVSRKQFLKSMGPIVTWLQNKITEVYQGVKSFVEILYIFEETSEKSDKQLKSVYTDDVILAVRFATKEK